MKLLMIIWLTVCFCAANAQPVFFDGKKLKENGLNEKQLDQQYGVLPEITTSLDVPFSIGQRMQKAYQEVLGKDVKQPLSITTHLYLSEQGKIDYFIFYLAESSWVVENGQAKQKKAGYNLDSLGAVLKQNLPPNLEGFASNRNWNRKNHIRFFTMLGEGTGMERSKPPKKKGTITDITEAMSASDTLSVKNLSLDRSLLTSFPDVVYRFPNVEVLSMVNNDISELIIDMARLPKLKNIDLSGNLLTAEGVRISPNKSLKILNLQKNQLTNIPAGLKHSKRLESLWLGLNKFSGLTNGSFRPIRRIKDLNLYKTEISVLPKGIKKIRKLEVLDLYHNTLTAIPPSITRLRRITHLAVAYNQLTALPPKLGKMKKMTHLYAHHNRLSKLPGGLGSMKNLQILDLGFNWFTDFPNEIAGLARLQELELTSNNFQKFPQGLLQVKHLDKVFLRGNPFIEDKANVSYVNQLDDLKSRNVEVFH